MITKRVSFPNSTLDDALWAAYRRYDKTAVTKKLLYRLLARRAPVRYPQVGRGELLSDDSAAANLNSAKARSAVANSHRPDGRRTRLENVTNDGQRSRSPA
jgi:hypothetical protein